MADYGMAVYGPGGVPFLKVTDSLCRYIGYITTGYGSAANESGSVSIPQWANGRPWFTAHKITDNQPLRYLIPSVWRSGTTLHWAFQGASKGVYDNQAQVIIWVGMY